jgi:hypothetical protein
MAASFAGRQHSHKNCKEAKKQRFDPFVSLQLTKFG